MMDPIYPWLDPNEVRRLAERLLNPTHATAMSAADAGFGETFIGYGAHEVTPLTALPSAPEPAEGSPQSPPIESAIQTTPEPPVAENFTTAHGPLLDRITRFCDWMHRDFSATDLFILDRDSAVIFDESRHGRLHFLARSVALAPRRPAASMANVRVKIGAGATLEVIPVETADGCLILGAVVPDSLSPASIALVMDALAQVASPTAGG